MTRNSGFGPAQFSRCLWRPAGDHPPLGPSAVERMAAPWAKAALVAVVALALTWTPAAAEVEVGGVAYDHVDPGEPFTAAAQPRETHQPARPTRAEKSAGIIAYWRPAPEMLLPWSRPRPQECIRRPLKVFAALGETEPLWVALYALDDVTSIAARLEGLPPRVTAEIFVVHFWPQRTSWKTRQYYITPELLLPYDADAGKVWMPGRSVLVQKSYDLKAATTGALWIRLTVDGSAVPGDYHMRLLVQAKGRGKLEVPLRLTVLPVKLRKPPDRRWLLYGDMWRWQKMSDEQRWLDARDIAAHGIDGVVEMPLGSPDLTELKRGRIKWDVSQTRRYLELLQQAGLRGPWVMSGRLAPAVRDALGIKADLYKKPWPDAVRRGVQTAAAALNEIYSGMGLEWYFYGWDEPSARNIYAVEQYKNWHAGGAPVYVTICQPGFWETMAQYLTAPCFSTGMIRMPRACEAVRRQCQRLGTQFWWYGSGCYIGQEGRLFPNRFLAGYFFWKTGARCQVSWTYTRPHEDPFNDFDGIKANRAEPKEQCIIYPWWEKPGDWSSYRGPIQTIQWEALREGIDDYCYLWTLAHEALRASSAPSRALQRAGRHARRALRDIEAMVPWLSDARGLGFTNADLQSLRWLVAQQIVTLREEKLAEPGTRLPTVEVPVTVEVTPGGEGSPASAPLPVTRVARAGAPPVINGRLDDAAWQNAAALAVDRDVRTGKRVSPPATAWLAFDDQYLYVAAKCVEPDMDGLVVQRTQRDADRLWWDDSVEIFIDPSGTRQHYAHFIINAAGVVRDELGLDVSWNCRVRVAAARWDKGWAVELAVPWADLERAGMPRSAAMALNVCRNRPESHGQGFEAAWSVTGGWYHIPERFGVALLADGPLAVADIQPPHLVGPGALKLMLENSTAERMRAKVAAALLDPAGKTVSVASPATVAIAAHGKASVNLPLNVPLSGRLRLQVTVETRGGPRRVVEVPVQIAEPAEVGVKIFRLTELRRLQIPLRLNVAGAGRRRQFLLRLYAAGRRWWSGRLECVAGQKATMETRAVLPRQAAWLEIALLDEAGHKIWRKRVPMLPVYQALH